MSKTLGGRWIGCPAEDCDGELYIRLDGSYERDTNAGPELIIIDACEHVLVHGSDSDYEQAVYEAAEEAYLP